MKKTWAGTRIGWGGRDENVRVVGGGGGGGGGGGWG